MEGDMDLLEVVGTVEMPQELGVWMRQNARMPWHAIAHFNVHIYAAMGGGYGDIVAGQPMCKAPPMRLDEAQIRKAKPDWVKHEATCVDCERRIEEAL